MSKLVRRVIGWMLVLTLVAAQILIPFPMQANATEAWDYAGNSSAANDIQAGVTLHCWNWSFENIEKNMALIASLGYTAIQTSPIQLAKQTTVGYPVNDWWVYYQPAGFNIDNTGNNALGNKAQFESMCETAHQYGIYVIVDVVANHMANSSANNLSDSIIADIRNDSSCWHDYSRNIDNYYDRYNITQYCLDGLPDLNTSSSKVQGYVLNYLKECIDSGADGFRFDAVKHIETPEDTYCASNFWPTVIDGAKSYATSARGLDLYCYGELLYHPDEGGSLPDSAYTKYMNVTDNSWSNSVRNNVVGGGNASAFGYGFHKNAEPNQLVLWAESHDNYAGDGTSGVSVQNINKTWALVTARADAMSLYLARPENTYPQLLGVASMTGWSYPEVAAVNHFHNYFHGQSEYVSNMNNIAYVERGNSGAVLVNCGGTSTSVSVTANTMADGTYTDQITGNTFTVSNGSITGQIGSTGIAVIYNAVQCDHPSHDTNGNCTSCNQSVGHSYVNGYCTVCGVEEPELEYYLIGYINGADYGCNDDYANLGDYKFVDGKVTVTFDKDSYVFVKTGDNQNWYMTQEYVSGTTGVFYNTETGAAEKMLIPGGMEVTITLTVNADDTLTLNYATSGCTHSYDDGEVTTAATCTTTGVKTYTCSLCGYSYTQTIPATGHSYVDGYCTVCGEADPGDVTDYYLIGYINGADYGCNDDYANLGDYKFVDGKVTVTFDKDSYVFVKTGDNQNWYMTQAYVTDTAATLYSTSNGATEKMFVPGGVKITFTLTVNNDNTLTLSYAEAGCDHSYDDGEVTTAVTCTTAGVKTYTCTVCGDTYTESIAATGHNYESVVTDPTFDTEGYTTHTCTACGHSYVDSNVPANGFVLAGANTVLGGVLDMNFFIDPSDLNGTDYYAQITLHTEDGTVITIVPYADWEVRTDYLVVTQKGLAARQMTDQLEVVIYKADGAQASFVWNDSIRDYAMRILEKQTDKCKTLIVDMLNYGAAAQSFFEYNVDNLANNQLSDAQKAYATETVTCTDRRVQGEGYYGSTLTLKDRIMLSLYFSNITPDMYAIVSFTDYKGGVHETRVEGSDFSMYNSTVYGVVVDELVVADGDQLVTVTVYDAEGNAVASGSDSVNSYTVRQMGKDEIYEMVARFTNSAYAYFG